ncbi:MAG: PAS domain S-box protein, partial [Candidatus Thorarchaeota archaeon]
YSKEEILKMKVTDFLVEEVISNVIDEIIETMSSGVVNKSKTYKVRKKNGDFIYVEANAIPLKKAGEYYAILGIGHDVTAYKKVEENLIISEKKYRHLFQQSPFNIILFDSMGNIIDSNGVLVKKLSLYSGIDFQGKNFLEIISYFQNSEELTNLFTKRLIALQQGEDLDPLEFSIITKDDKEIWLSWQSSKLEIDNQIFIQVIIEDITERKNAEQKLVKSEAKFRNIIENTTDVIVVTQFDGKHIYMSPQYSQLLGYTEEEADKIMFELIHPEDRQRIINLYTKAAAKKQTYVSEIEQRWKHKDGHYIWVATTSKNYYNEDGEIVGWITSIRDISERKKAELKLRESEEKFKALFKGSPVPALAWQKVNEDLRLIDYNNALLEYSQDDMRNYLGVNASVFFQNRPELLEMLYKTFEEKTHISREIRYFVNIKEEKRDFLANLAFIPPDLVLLYVDDITDKKKAEDNLLESEKILRDFVHNATDSISIWDSNLNLIELNDVAADPWDSPNPPVKGIHMTKLAPEITETDRYKKYLEIIKTGIPFSFDNVVIPPKVGERYFKIKAFKVGNGLGIIGTEITDHIRFEQELKESEEKFRTIAEQSFMGIIIIQDGKIKYINKVLAQMAEYPIEELIEFPEKLIIKMIHPDDVGYLRKRLQSNIDGTMSQFSQNSFRIITKSGEIRWLEDYTSKIIFQGKAANLISIIDVTDKKQAEQLIVEENKRLLELEELRKDIITRVSHELKTPMTSIYGANQILTRLYLDQIGEEAQKYVEIGLRGSLRMKQLIDNLLDVSRLDAKRLDLRLQEENIVELIIDCVKDMNYLATDRQLRIKLELPNELYHNIDRLRFRQVLSNLISNAIKNTPMSGEILISIEEDHDFLSIRIKDTGVGITEKEKEKLFEKFGKIERYGMDLGVDIEGSGLGLYISKEIIELHGGQIIVESEGRNKGSSFIVRLFKD